MLMSKQPSATTVRYAAGIDCRKVEDGVMGERNDSVKRTASSSEDGPGIKYVKFVVEASNVRPRYSGNVTLYKRWFCGRESCGRPRSGYTLPALGTDAMTEKPI